MFSQFVFIGLFFVVLVVGMLWDLGVFFGVGRFATRGFPDPVFTSTAKKLVNANKRGASLARFR